MGPLRTPSEPFSPSSSKGFAEESTNERLPGGTMKKTAVYWPFSSSFLEFFLKFFHQEARSRLEGACCGVGCWDSGGGFVELVLPVAIPSQSPGNPSVEQELRSNQVAGLGLCHSLCFSPKAWVLACLRAWFARKLEWRHNRPDELRGQRFRRRYATRWIGESCGQLQLTARNAPWLGCGGTAVRALRFWLTAAAKALSSSGIILRLGTKLGIGWLGRAALASAPSLADAYACHWTRRLLATCRRPDKVAFWGWGGMGQMTRDVESSNLASRKLGSCRGANWAFVMGSRPSLQMRWTELLGQHRRTATLGWGISL